MTIYDRLQASSASMLIKYGGQITLQKSGPSAYDPTSGTNKTSTTTYLGVGTITDFSNTNPAVTTIVTTDIQQGDKLMFLSVQGTLNGLSVTVPRPGVDDAVTGPDGTVYNVKASTTINPSGATPVIHVAHLRGVQSTS